MSLNTKTFTQNVTAMVAAIQGKASALVDFSVGSIMLAWTEAVAGVVDWLQSLVVALMAYSRASTATGADLDSFYADFNFYRLPAVKATGVVTLSRLTASASSISIPVGSSVETQDGSQSFLITADTGYSTYDLSTNSYVLAANTQSIDVPVQAVTAGSGANVVAGAINTITTALPGIDTVTNASPLTNGEDPEIDSAFRTRFVEYISSLERGTPQAVEFAVDSLQLGLTRTVVENQDKSGANDYGFFYVVVDDGTGNPSASLITTVYNAVDAYRAITTRFGVFGPNTVTAAVSATVTAATGYDSATVKSDVQAKLEAYINTLPLGKALEYLKLAQVIYNVSGVASVTNLLLNGATSDVSAASDEVIKYSAVTIS